jgi:hypothetical protein
LNSCNRVGRGKGVFQTYFQRLLKTVALRIVIALRSALAPLSVLLGGHHFFFWDALPRDRYKREAGLMPALPVALPAVLAAFAWFPAFVAWVPRS